jgi:FkbM family methyltransferase
VPINVALDDRIGTAKFLINRNFQEENVLYYDRLKFNQLIPQKIEEYEKVTVPTSTLQNIMDEQHIERIDFLKMDCQGAEGPILSTTPQSYLQRINKVAMEYHDHICLLKHQDLQKILEEAGFTTLVKQIDDTSPLGFLYGWRA